MFFRTQKTSILFFPLFEGKGLFVLQTVGLLRVRRFIFYSKGEQKYEKDSCPAAVRSNLPWQHDRLPEQHL